MQSPLPRSLSASELFSPHSLLPSLVGRSADQAWGLLPAAGVGSRAGPGLAKQYRQMNEQGSTLLECSLTALAQGADVLGLGGVLVVLAPDDTLWDTLLAGRPADLALPVVAARIGGPSRPASVLAGLVALQQAGLHPMSWAVVHDAARPGLPLPALARLADRLQACPLEEDPLSGALLALPVADTLQRASESGCWVASTVSREGLWAAQTPQAFRLQPLISALLAMPDATDEASAMRAAGGRAYLVEGALANRKYTRPDDFLES